MEEASSALALDGSYDPIAIESRWLKFWEEVPHVANAERAVKKGVDEKFVMVTPPPNVTGSLHIGHSIMAAIEDALTRWHRMSGRETLWLPGLDHAGIATQAVVEKSLLQEGTNRRELGREKFLERVIKWKDEKGGRILYQLKRLGCSCDWSREAFTMSPELSSAVIEAFVRLYDQKLIYRDERLVSWSPFLNTALSEIEVDTEEFDRPSRVRIPGFEKTVEVGMLWHFKYAIKGGDSEQFIEVATTRIETMLGDVAVAVNPNDPRYKDFIGRFLIHPFFPERVMTVIGDEHCDVEFGTGAVKITPAHDKNDWEIGKRHKLESISIFTFDGKINNRGGPYSGLHRFEARVQIERDLEKLGLMVGKVNHSKKMALPRCSRSGDIVEYMLVPQWYVNCGGMAKRAADAVRQGDLRLLPEGSEKQWYHWLENIKDWCVSRQLWWGHRVPAFRVVRKEGEEEEEEWVVARNMKEARERAGKQFGLAENEFELTQDEDVLDTWFSSGLFPFSTMGWPDENKMDFKAFFPNSLLETGADILFFWVARMVMLSLTLTDQLPFRTVFLHPVVRDAHGKKMSKSLGNIVDPIDVIYGKSLQDMTKEIELQKNFLKEAEIQRAITARKKDFPNGIEECGADALRFGLLAYLKGGRSVNLDINRVVGYRHFCNKLWNACKLAMTFFKAAVESPDISKVCNSEQFNLPLHQCHWTDRWILSRSSRLAKKANLSFSNFDLEAGVTALYSFWLYDFCDIYLELLKTRLAHLTSSPNEYTVSSIRILFIVMDRGLRLIHPFMPFISEHLWQTLTNVEDASSSGHINLIVKPVDDVSRRTVSISLAKFPLDIPQWEDDLIEAEQIAFMQIVRSFRSQLAQFEVSPKLRLQGFLAPTQQETDVLTKISNKTCDIATLAKLRQITLLPNSKELTDRNLVTNAVTDKIVSGLDPENAIQFEAVEKKLSKKATELSNLIERAQKKMSAPDYADKVPTEVRTRDREAVDAYLGEQMALNDALATARKFLQKGGSSLSKA